MRQVPRGGEEDGGGAPIGGATHAGVAGGTCAGVRRFLGLNSSSFVSRSSAGSLAAGYTVFQSTGGVRGKPARAAAPRRHAQRIAALWVAAA